MAANPVNNPLGIAWMLGAAVAFSGLFVAVRELGAVLPTFEILFLRSVFTIALMIPWLCQEKLNAFRSKRPSMHLLRGASTFTAMSMLFYGVAHSPLADASALQSTYPLFTIMLVAVFLGEGGAVAMAGGAGRVRRYSGDRAARFRRDRGADSGFAGVLHLLCALQHHRPADGGRG